MEAQELAGGQPIVEAEVFGQEADARAGRAVAQRPAQERGLTGGGGHQPEQHLDRGRLAGAVGAQEAEDLTTRDLQGEAAYRHVIPKEGEAAYRHVVPKDLTQRLGFDRVRCRQMDDSWCNHKGTKTPSLQLFLT